MPAADSLPYKRRRIRALYFGGMIPGVRFKGACPPPITQHNALADARWNHTLMNFIVDTTRRQPTP